MGITPIICGGTSEKSCYSLKEDGTWKDEADLNEDRYGAANGYAIDYSTKIDSNARLVIAGGANSDNTNLATIELVAPNTQPKTFPKELSAGVKKSCIVQLDYDIVMIIGGKEDNGPTDKTHIIFFANNTIVPGPRLLTARQAFACNILRVEDEDYIIVAGGHNGGLLRTTEILAKANFLKSEWKKGKNI